MKRLSTTRLAAGLLSLAAVLPVATSASAQSFGAIYTLTNDSDRNAVQVTVRTPGGHLFPFTKFATGGRGNGAGLGSQGALASSGRYLLAVNAGSDEVTLFRNFGFYLWRTDTDASGGTRPTSVAVRGSLVYVLNAGSDNITGFRIRRHRLESIRGATYSLSRTNAAAAQVDFSPDGRFVVVTERATNRIGVFPVRRDGTLGAGKFQASSGQTPFGFLFRRDGTLVVGEANGGMANSSYVSTYRIQRDGTLKTITVRGRTDQTAACWIAIPRSGRFAYTTNTASGTVTGFGLNRAGSLSRLDRSGATGDLGSAARPIDFDFSRDGRLLFVLDSGGDKISGFRRNRDGSLTKLRGSVSVPDGTAGLLAR